MGFQEGEKATQDRVSKREAEKAQREQEGSLLMRGAAVDYPIDKTSRLRGTASATLSGGFKVRGVKIEFRKEF